MLKHLPSDLRNESDAKVFDKMCKTQLLDSITNEKAYVVNNTHDYWLSGRGGWGAMYTFMCPLWDCGCPMDKNGGQAKTC